MDPIMLIALAIVALVLAIWLLIIVVGTALIFLRVAASFGILGVALYVAAWVFLFPVMVMACAVVGIAIQVLLIGTGAPSPVKRAKR